jgi:ribosomal protein L11 methyltransferase
MKTTFSLTFTTLVDNQELVDAVLYTCGALGCQETDAGSRTIRTAWFADPGAARRAAEALSLLPDTALEPMAPVPPQDWIATWRASMQPAQLTDTIWVSPKWLPPPARPNDFWIKIEPKMAFGTGHHATTRLAARGVLAAGNEIAALPFLDIGTGSGVLCFVADHCGASSVIGIEIDYDCCENLAENRIDNQGNTPPGFIIGGIECLKPGTVFGGISMNMIRTQSEPLLAQCTAMLMPGGALIWSGILIDEKEKVVAAAVGAGFTVVSELYETEWWCGIFRKQCA